MKLLLDSHVLLWSLSDRTRVTPRVLRLLEMEENELLISMASLWELSIKIAKGKLSVPNSSVRALFDELDNAGIPVLPITRPHSTHRSIAASPS